VTSRSGSGDPVTPDQLVSQSMDALASASSVHIWGALPVDGAQAHVDLHLGASNGSARFRIRAYDVQVRTVDGETYIQGNDAYTKQLITPARRAELLPKYSGKWLHFPRDYVQAHYTGLTNLTLIKYFQEVIPKAAAEVSYQDGGPKIVRGMATSSVFDKRNGVFLYFPQTGTPYPVAFSSNAHYLHLNFNAWNKPVGVSVPPARQTLELTATH
jgi:hypothetical protein